MSGTPSEILANPPGHKFDPPAGRGVVRITNIYGTSWTDVPHPGPDGQLSRHLRFGRLAGYVDHSQDQLPHVVARQALTVDQLGFRRWAAQDRVVNGRLWLIHLSSGQAVVAFSLDVATPPLGTIDLLEDCYYLDVTVDGVPLESYARDRLADGRTTGERLAFEPERHQIVFCGPLPEEQTEEIAQKLIYRSDLPYRKEFSAITYPNELNRRPGSTAAVGPYVSMLSNQQDYIENSALLSAVQAVASWVRLREIREAAYADLRLFRDAEPTRRSLLSRRHTLERVVNQLSDLELELSYTVESPADLEILVPSLRVASYHNALFDCMGLCDKAETVGRMLGRLDRSVRAELTAIESIERRADDDRRLRWTVAVGFLSTVALPITLALAFFGVNAKEVDQKLSMFDDRYLPLYVFIASIGALGVFLSLGLYLQQRLTLRRETDNAVARPAVPPTRPPVPRQPVRARQ